jgi:hypothetical protein
VAVTAPPSGPGVPTPDPVRETPPADRFCDLILNGGVASGVVYPWALVELARHYRFRSIGGNSVGAMAAALAAAAEYGRCSGNPNAFEVLRRAPLDLAEEDPEGRTRMLRLFQPSPKLRRLFDLLLLFVRESNPVNTSGLVARSASPKSEPQGSWKTIWNVLKLYRLDWVLMFGLWAIFALILWLGHDLWSRTAVRTLGLVAVLCAMVAFAIWQLLRDLRALADNNYGLCPGKAQPGPSGEAATQEALVEWLHRGIQLSAGRGQEDPPLTFADLWNAPRAGRPVADAVGDEPSIELQMFSTIVTQARPIGLPLADGNPRLFFRPQEWSKIFPEHLVRAVVDATSKYSPQGPGDPDAGPATDGLYEVPRGALPIAIAARMSLSFPILFTCVPVYAIDYEALRGFRQLRQCQTTDGGLCTNFPIHLFDAAHPRWPTFGMMLSRRLANFRDDPTWLPRFHQEGRADNWLREVPGAEQDGVRRKGVAGLLGLLKGMLMTTLDWNDNLTSRLPTVRNRVLRMELQQGEGQLNISMPGVRILDMAHKYGTLGGKKLTQTFVGAGGKPAAAWQEHLYVRAMNQLNALRDHLCGFTDAVTAAGHTTPIAAILEQATRERPLDHRPDRLPDPEGGRLTRPQADALEAAVQAVCALEQALQESRPDAGPYRPAPAGKLRLRSRI